jgi:hypothetical protein
MSQPRQLNRKDPKAAKPQAHSNPNLITPQRPNLQTAEKGIGFLCVSEIRVSAVQKFRGIENARRKTACSDTAVQRAQRPKL